MNERVLIVTIAGRKIALPAPRVHSVIEIETIMPVPKAPAFVAGISALRSRILTVVDPRLALGLATSGHSCRQAVVLESAGHLFALLVDSALDVTDQQSAPSTVIGGAGDGWSHVALGMIETAAGPVLLVDAERLIRGPDRCAA